MLRSKAINPPEGGHKLTCIKWGAGSGGLDHEELVEEFERIGLTAAEAQNIMHFHRGDNNETIDVDTFIDILVHVLENAIHALSASDTVTIAYLFDKYDENGDGSMVSSCGVTLALPRYCLLLHTTNLTQLSLHLRSGC